MAETGLTVAQLTGQQVRMALSPLPTVTKLVIHLTEAYGRPAGPAASWRGALRDALEPSDLAALSAVFGGPGGVQQMPDTLTPIPTAFTASFDDDLERVAAVPGDELASEIEEMGLLTTRWSVVARAPHRWRDAYLMAMRRAWPAVAPLWAQAAPLLDREVERVGTALARGAFGPLLDGLHRRGHVKDDDWVIDGASRTIATNLRLAPMVSTPSVYVLGTAEGTTDDDGPIAYLAYPVPGARRLLDQSRLPSSHATPLEALLGVPRAAILQGLDSPTPAGQLASDLLLSPSAITHHLTALERAGLVTRERDGRRVLVHRSARGTTLLHLYLN
jgi:DNA-binding transcriptional ArsR family regulator